MDTSSFGLLEYVSPGARTWEDEIGSPRMELRLTANASPPLDAETLRRCAWEIGETRPADAYVPVDKHVDLSAVTPNQGFAYWRICQAWVDETSRRRGGAWHNC